MINFLKKFLTVLVILLIIDVPVLYNFMAKDWANMIQKIQQKPMKVKLTFAFITYLFMTAAIVLFVLPRVSNDNIIRDSILVGGTLGLIIYAIFDLTNLSIIQNYDFNIAVTDIFWGFLLFSITTYIYKIIINYIL